MPKNYGLDWERELREQKATDWRYGAASPIDIAAIPDAEREDWLPAGEIQRSEYDDMMDCASRGPLNIIEAKLTYLYTKGLLLPDNKKFLEDNGYVTAKGKIELSDAFVAINSGTTRDGNSLKAPLDSIRTQGVIPKKLLPLVQTMTWEQYMDVKRVTPDLLKLGIEWKERFSMNYERVENYDFPRVAVDSFIDVAGFAWPDPVNGEYPKTSGPFNHCFVIFQLPAYYIFDNYLDNGRQGDFIKRLAADYTFAEYGYRVVISSQQVPPQKPDNGWIKATLQFLADMTQSLILYLGIYRKRVQPSADVALPSQQMPVPATPVDPDSVVYPWDSQKHNWHNVRVLCDKAKLSVADKNIICACIYQESEFFNILPSGLPVTHKNMNAASELLSTDWGIAQINDYWHVKATPDFPSAEYIVAHPEEAVGYMIRCYKAGNIDLWSSYVSGAYKKWLSLKTSPMWELAKA